MRRQFFGEQGTTEPVVQELLATLPHYRHLAIDIRDRQAVRQVFDDRAAPIHYSHRRTAFTRQSCGHPL